MNKNTFFIGLIIFCVTFTAYSFMLQGEFKTMDDEMSIVNNEDIKDIANAGKLLTSSYFGSNAYYRPLASISYTAEYHFFGLNAFSYYLTNIFIHIATSIGVFLLMNYLFRQRLFAFCIALLFAIHPIHWEAVSNISGRAILLSAFFIVKAFYCFCYGQRRKRGYVFSLIFFVCALLSKESAAVFPLLLLSYQFFMARKPGDKVMQWTRAVIPFVVIDVVYVALRYKLGITHLFHWPTVMGAVVGFCTFLRGVITFVRLSVFPVGLHFDRSLALFPRIIHGELLLTLLFFAAAFTVLFRKRTKLRPEVKFFISWFVIELLPVSQIVTSIGVQPGYISLAEHFMYVPVLGLIVLAALWCQGTYRRVIERNIISPNIFKVCIGIIYCFFFVMTIQQNIYASNEIAMLERTLQLNPNNARIRSSLGLAYARLNRFAEAEEHFLRAVALDPFHPRQRIGLGKSLIDQGKVWEGIEEYEKVMNPGKYTQLLKQNLAFAYEALIRRYENMLEEHPDDSPAHYSLGVAYSKTGKFTEAIQHFKQAITVNPQFKDALFNLASTYALNGELKYAAQYYQRMLALEGPEDALDYHAYYHLGQIYQKLGDTEAAATYNEMAKRVKAMLEMKNSK